MIKDEKIFLKHILEEIKDIEIFSKGLSLDKFEKDKLKQKAIIRSIEIIGEAVKNLPIGFMNEYPYIEWNKIAGARDKIVHHYFGVDLEIIWKIVNENLPTLKKEISEILKKLEKNKNEK